MARRAVEANERHNMKRILMWALIIFLIIAIPTTLVTLFNELMHGITIIMHNVQVPTTGG
jgi:hypothetical protein